MSNLATRALYFIVRRTLYLPWSRGNAPLGLCASQTRSSSCPAGSSPHPQGWGWCPAGSWSQSPSCFLPEPHPLGLYVPANWKTEQESEQDAKQLRNLRGDLNTKYLTTCICLRSYQFSYLGSLLTIPSFSRPARILAVSSGVPVTTWTLEGLHSSTAPFTKSATAGGSEGMEARDRTLTVAPTPPCLKEK